MNGFNREPKTIEGAYSPLRAANEETIQPATTNYNRITEPKL